MTNGTIKMFLRGGRLLQRPGRCRDIERQEEERWHPMNFWK